MGGMTIYILRVLTMTRPITVNAGYGPWENTQQYSLYPFDLIGEVFYCTKPSEIFSKNFATNSAAVQK